MSGKTELLNRLKKCEKGYRLANKQNKRGVAYVDDNGELILEPGIVYNDGVLAVPLPMTIEEWEQKNIDEGKKDKKTYRETYSGS